MKKLFCAMRFGGWRGRFVIRIFLFVGLITKIMFFSLKKRTICVITIIENKMNCLCADRRTL